MACNCANLSGARFGGLLNAWGPRYKRRERPAFSPQSLGRLLMPFISFAQNFEDVMLWRALKHVGSGFYIDVGASDPVVDSITKAFYDRGWHGINIEPKAESFDRICRDRPRDINLQVAVGAQPGSVTFYDNNQLGLSTCAESEADRRVEEGFAYECRNVTARMLCEICSDHAHGDIHFLKIDVEGWERQVLLGMDFQRFRPWVLVIESTKPNSQVQSHADWEPLVLAAGYEFVYFDGLNRFYVAREHAELKDAFTAPPNFFDQFKRADEWLANDPVSQRAFALVEANKQLLARSAELIQTQQQLATRNAELLAVYESWSWRLTLPLRVGNQIRRRLFSAMKGRTTALLSLSRRLVKASVRHDVVVQEASHALSHGSPSSLQTQAPPPRLSERATVIFEDLKRAIRKD